MLTFVKKLLLGVLVLFIAVWAYAYTRLMLEEHEYYTPTQTELTAAEQYLDGKLYPAPESWRWQDFITDAKVMLRTGRADAANAKGTVIFVPGFTGTLEMSMDIIAGLHQAGFNVAGIEYRGQGGSYRPLAHPEKGYVESYELLADEVAQFARANHTEGLPLFFYSISKGGHITMRMAAENLVDVNAYALVVPMIKINPAPVDYDQLALLANILSALGLGDMYSPGQKQFPVRELIFGQQSSCNGNPDTAQIQHALFTLNPSLRTRGVTVKWVNETVASSKKLLDPDFTTGIKQPVKVFTSGVDEFVSTDAIRQFCGQLENCSATHFEQARHCVNAESAERRDQILREALAHFEANLG